MAALDLAPNRLEFCRNVVARLVERNPRMRIGLTTFAGASRERAAVSVDHRNLMETLNHTERDEHDDGTAIGLGLATAVFSINDVDAPRRAILLLTDGVNNDGPLHPGDAARLAEHFRIQIHSIGIGDDGPAPIPYKAPDGKQRRAILNTGVDEPLLREIAARTAGGYLRASGGSEPIALADTIESLVLKSDMPPPSADPMDLRSLQLLHARSEALHDTPPMEPRSGRNASPSEPSALAKTFTAKVDARRVYLNDVLTLTLTLHGVTDCAKPALPKIDGFNVHDSTASVHSTTKHGKTSVSASFTYRLKPRQVGAFEIPAIHYTHDGTTYVSTPLLVEVEPDVFPAPPPGKAEDSAGDRLAGFEETLDTADEEPFAAKIDAERIDLQDILNFKLTLRGSVDKTAPALPDIPGFRLLDTTHSSRVSMVHGKTRQSVTFTYRLKPLHTGTFEIPPVTHRFLGQTHSSRPLRVVVDRIGSSRSKPEKRPPVLELETQVSRTRVALGQSFDIRLVLYSTNRVNSLRPVKSRVFPGFWQEWQPSPTKTRTVKTTRGDEPCMYHQFNTARLWPLHLGKIEVPSVIFDVDFDLFDGDLFESLADPKRHKTRVASTPVTIEVVEQERGD